MGWHVLIPLVVSYLKEMIKLRVIVKQDATEIVYRMSGKAKLI